MKQNVVVATTTFYKSPEDSRFRYADSLVRKALQETGGIIIVDGSPDPKVPAHFESLGAIVYKQTAKGMGASRRELFQHVGKAIRSTMMLESFRPHLPAPEIILWTEPEKDDIVQWVPKMVAPIENGEADIVIAERTEKSWETYPAFQRASEPIGNRVFKETTGLDVDIFSGPAAFHVRLLPIYATCNPAEFGAPDTYIQHFAPLQAMKAGYKIASVEVDFEYPPEQKAEEEGAISQEMQAKRLWQLGTLIDGYFNASRALKLRG